MERRHYTMKKFVSICAVISCVFALTACGGTEANTLSGTPLDASMESSIVSYGESLVAEMDSIVRSGAAAQYEDDAVFGPALSSYENALDDIGDVEGYDNEQAVTTDDGDYMINIGIDGSEHDADVVITVSSAGSPSNVAVNVRYSFAELMEQAALNTILGMGTTFIILILLAVIISCFAFIGKAQDNQKKKAAALKEAEAPAAQAAPAPAAETPAADDGELIAVIAAAIAASEGQTTTDGFVVRSIRKSRRKF